MNRRENTFRIDYAKVPKKPSFEEVHLFIGNQLGMKREEVKRIQCSRLLGCAFVKANDLSVAQGIVENHDGKHEIVVGDKKYPIRLTMEDGAVDVKLFDLSEDVSDLEITKFMSDYGEILSIRELMWEANYMFNGYPTGVRVVRMIVKKNIPSTVIIDGEATCVQYYGQQHTCRHCNEAIHNGISCIQNKKLLVQKFDADHSKQSYANVAKQAVSKVNAPKQSRSRGLSSSGLKIRPANVQAPTAGASRESATVIPTNNAHGKIQKTLSTGAPPADTSQTLLTIPAQELFKKPQHNYRPESTSTASIETSVENSRHDGNETDESTSSNSSRRLRARPCAKKIRHDHDVMNDFPQL